ncbi:MAG: DNA polymerase IV [Candidatus Aramenus sulfurataquae]|uniref:DNA polymerase IV n=1 Tax=Candidatus Aramenus sulfurataquae TaxID=1326980 RepID=W7L5I0_9CREN|nr:MAG: DNA polymerase IV [Candidatus Aramenus sulfurataquae]
MIVALADIDYFFAQVEEILNPSLRGKPVVVCVYSGRTKDSGAVATANYEARRLGVKSGMPIIKAKEIAPDAVYLPMRKELYKEVSKRVMSILAKYADKVEVASVDEAYLDITGKARNYDEAYALMKKMKEEVKEREGLTMTVGVAPNKAFAKVIAERSKPNGLGVLREEEVPQFISTLDISEVPGVGKVLEERLRGVGVNKLGDVLKVNSESLVKAVGKKKANYLLSLANNTYNEPVKERKVKHQGRYLTLKSNTRQLEEILPYLRRAIEEAYAKVDGIPKSIAVVAIMEDLDIVSREKSFTYGLDKVKAFEEARKLLEKILQEDKRKLRRVGVRLGKIYKSTTLDKFFNL